jgi:Ser/Thr protein kinase RdoA (MazF antagonist)
MLKTLRTYYNIDNPKINKLVGYDSTNYRVESNSEKYILKIYHNNKSEIEQANAENKILLHLQKEKNNRFPAPVKNKNNRFLTSFSEKKEKRYARMLTYLEGDFLGETKHSIHLFKSFGEFLAKLNIQLQSFKNKAIQTRQFKWDLQHFLLNEKYIEYIIDSNDRKIVEHFFQQYKNNVLPVISSLRKQIIHNDANEWNTLTNNNKVTGLIDFGDVCYTQTINELAIALAYALFKKDAPLKWAVHIISEYKKTLPLEEKEINILYWLIAARLCTTVCNSAYEKVQRPENKYIKISEKPAWELLRKWINISPELAHREFNKANEF